MFHLHLLIALISFKKYLKTVKKIVLVLKGVITIIFFIYKIPTKIPNKEEILNFRKT